ncbi:MAG: hypothetical protein ACNYPE_07585 [Candidatus Azotimanducaceae bacterium WSBS_2022_MAG_OTU7]
MGLGKPAPLKHNLSGFWSRPRAARRLLAWIQQGAGLAAAGVAAPFPAIREEHTSTQHIH